MPREEDFNQVHLEFVNSRVACVFGVHLGVVWEGLAELPEAYEILPFGLAQDDSECAVRGSEETKTPEALPRTSEGRTLVRTPVVSIPDKNPSCPCCATPFTRMQGLIDHLKRTHRQKIIIFKCSKCGKQNL